MLEAYHPKGEQRVRGQFSEPTRGEDLEAGNSIDLGAESAGNCSEDYKNGREQAVGELLHTRKRLRVVL